MKSVVLVRFSQKVAIIVRDTMYYTPPDCIAVVTLVLKTSASLLHVVSGDPLGVTMASVDVSDSIRVLRRRGAWRWSAIGERLGGSPGIRAETGQALPVCTTVV